MNDAECNPVLFKSGVPEAVVKLHARRAYRLVHDPIAAVGAPEMGAPVRF